MKSALTIAGFDPTGGAGLQADLRVFRAAGVYGLSAVAALTAQNTTGVSAVMPVAPGFLRRQLSVLLADVKPDATKIGMLLSVDNVKETARTIRKHRLENVVLDPVLRPSRGVKLSEPGVVEALTRYLLPLCTVATPNMEEASIIAGMKVRTLEEMREAARLIAEIGTRCVIVTGGHLRGEAIDVVYDGSFRLLRADRRQGAFHGTGCTFSSAVASYLALGHTTAEAAVLAKRLMRRAMQRAVRLGGGMRVFSF